MKKKTGKGMVEYAKSLVGTPYFYGCKLQILSEGMMERLHTLYPSTVTRAYILKARLKGQVGRKCADCSAIVGGYRGMQLGSAQLYQTAQARLSIDDYQKWADGVVCWRKGHVGVFFRVDAYCYVIEAKGIDYGTVLSNFIPKKWTCGLTFSDLEYEYNQTADHTNRQPNPYVEPIRNIGKGCRGEDVKWLQFELCEAGYTKEINKAGGIDGVFGSATLRCVKEFQKSCKIPVDGVVGPVTKRYLKTN